MQQDTIIIIVNTRLLAAILALHIRHKYIYTASLHFSQETDSCQANWFLFKVSVHTNLKTYLPCLFRVDDLFCRQRQLYQKQAVYKLRRPVE